MKSFTSKSFIDYLLNEEFEPLDPIHPPPLRRQEGCGNRGCRTLCRGDPRWLPTAIPTCRCRERKRSSSVKGYCRFAFALVRTAIDKVDGLDDPAVAGEINNAAGGFLVKTMTYVRAELLIVAERYDHIAHLNRSSPHLKTKLAKLALGTADFNPIPVPFEIDFAATQKLPTVTLRGARRNSRR